MKPQFSLTCILASSVLFTQLVSGISVASEPQVSLTTDKEVQEYANGIAEDIRKTAEAILSIPHDQQTFENTLRPWNRLSAQLTQDFNTLDVLGKLDSPSSKIASQISDDLKAYLLEVTQNLNLRQILMNGSLNTTRNAELNAFQRYIGAYFIKNGPNDPIYLRGSSEEQNSSATDFTVLNLKSGSLTASEVSDLANKVLSESTDVICIQEIVAEDDAYGLYEVLEKNYAHFLYVPPAAALDLPRRGCKSGMLIASKYRMEQTQFNTFLEEGSDDNEGFLDFVLKNTDTTLGHVYAANLKKDSLDEAISYKFFQIMEKMQDDVLKTEKKSIPFVLCGDLNSLQGSQKAKEIMNLCFGPQDNSSGASCTLILQSLPNMSINTDFEATASNTSMAMSSDHSGLRMFVKQTNPFSIKYDVNSILNSQQFLITQKIDTFMKGEFKILPVRSRRDRDDDKQAGGSVEFGGGVSWGGADGPQYDAYVRAEAHDEKGNYVEAEADHNFNTGEGNADVRGGSKK